MSDFPNLTDPIFHDEEAARAHFEAIRWTNGPVCPHCGTENNATLVKGKSHRKGMYQCNACREPFSVKVGTVMEASHIPYTKWALGFHLVASSKKGFSAHQLHRMLGVTYKTAWFMEHRIREAMRDAAPSPLGGSGNAIEADETYFGPKRGEIQGRGGKGKRAVVTLVERGGKARSFHVHDVSSLTLPEILRLNTDALQSCIRMRRGSIEIPRDPGKRFAAHHTVTHSADEYVRGEAHTNMVEGFFSIFKRGMRGVYQHGGDQHLHRYLAEEGKRLTYKQPRSA